MRKGWTGMMNREMASRIPLECRARTIPGGRPVILMAAQVPVSKWGGCCCASGSRLVVRSAGMLIAFMMHIQMGFAFHAARETTLKGVPRRRAVMV